MQVVWLLWHQQEREEIDGEVLAANQHTQLIRLVVQWGAETYED